MPQFTSGAFRNPKISKVAVGLRTPMMGTSPLGPRNLIVIGFEAQLSLFKDDAYEAGWLDGLERMFLCIYCAEAMFRAFSFGWQIVWDPWFVLDLTLVALGLLALVLVPMLTIGNVGNMPAIKKLFAVRSLRLLRLMRVLRMLRHFKIIWRLVIGFLTAWDTIFAATALLLTTLFIFSCAAVEFIAKDGDLVHGVLPAGPHPLLDLMYVNVVLRISETCECLHVGFSAFHAIQIV